MIATAKRVLPWINGLLTYLVWRAGRLLLRRRSGESPSLGGRVCVLQINSLGDVLMVTPVLRALIRALGAGQVDVVVSQRTAPILGHFSGLGRCVRLRTPLRWRQPRSVWEFIGTARDLRAQRYRAILDASRLVQTAWLTYLAAPARGIGFRLPRELGPFRVEGLGYLYSDEIGLTPLEHMIHQNLRLLAPLSVAAASERMELAVTPADQEATRAALVARAVPIDRPFAVIHPGAKWAPKRWHIERFAALASRLQAHGIAVVLIGDRGEAALLHRVAAGCARPPVILAGDLDLPGLAALIRMALLFIGNDSAPMHIASAVGTPVVGLFGPTFPEQTGPLGPRGRGLVKPIACRPCRLYFTRERCERGHNYCMDLIDIDEVWAAAQSLLGQAAGTQAQDGAG